MFAQLTFMLLGCKTSASDDQGSLALTPFRLESCALHVGWGSLTRSQTFHPILTKSVFPCDVGFAQEIAN